MSRVTIMQTSFNGGELSPFMLGRPDHTIWPTAVLRSTGFVPRPQGPNEACPGFEYIETAPGPCRLLPFEPDVTQGYVVEASDLLLRFYTNDVLLRSGEPLAPVEVVSPFAAEDLPALDYEPSTDVLYLFHREHQTRILARTDADAFELDMLSFANGPFQDRNSDESHTLAFDGVTGNVSVTSNKPLFAATDVGRLIEVEAHDLSDVSSWEPGITVTRGLLLQWDGRVYSVVGGSGSSLRTGTVAPVHTRGVEWDGIGTGQDLNEKDAGGVELSYMFDMFGRVRITGYTSPTQVSATVTRRLPLQLATASAGGGTGYKVKDYLPDWYDPDDLYDGDGGWSSPGSGSYTPGTWRWRLGAFSDTTGWPEHGCIWNQRLWLTLDDKIYGSVAGDLYDFDRLNEFGEISNDMAMVLQVDRPYKIKWIFAGSELFIGTQRAEYVLRPASTQQGIGPLNYSLIGQDSKGSATCRPVALGARPIFLQRNAHRLLHLIEDTYGRYRPDDLTRYADHIGNSRLIELCWQYEPLQLLWAVRGDGTLACANYLPEEQVLGWVPRELGGGMMARSATSITDPTGRYDQLWIATERDDVWWVQKLAPWQDAGERRYPALMSDAGLTYDDPENPISTISMPHLAGQTVEVQVADDNGGMWLGNVELDTEGAGELGASYGKIAAGLSFPAHFTLLTPEAGGDNGPAQGKMGRISRLTLRVQESLGFSVVDQSGRLTEVGNVTPATDLTTAIPALSKDVLIDIVGAWDRTRNITIKRDAPLPQTMLATIVLAEVSER